MSVLEIALLLFAVGSAFLVWALRKRSRAEIDRLTSVLAEERAQHELALKIESQRCAALFDRMVEGVIMLGPSGHIRFANPAAAALFEFTPSTVVGRTVLEATRHHEITELVRKLEEQPEVLEHELRLERRGTTRVVQVNALALAPGRGENDRALLVFHDLTRLRQLEAIRQDFVANVSHELRTPLSLVKSAVETLIDGGKNDPAIAARFLDIIDKHANRLTLLIDDLLLLARLDSGRLDLKLEPVALRGAVDEALADAALLARAREVRLTNEVPDGLIGQADPDRLRQVLANLVDNAIKYGRVNGAVVVAGRQIDSRMVELAVRDDGPGIPAEAKARIFERFYRVDKARAREQGGTGLGLAIVKNVVEAHGGDVRVESSGERGTTFYFTLQGV